VTWHGAAALSVVFDVDIQAVTVLAKQLVNLRKQKTKTYAVGSRIQAVGTQGKVKFVNCNVISCIVVIYYSTLIGEWSIVLTMSVCFCVCLCLSIIISSELDVRSAQSFLCMLPMAMVPSVL